MAPRKVLFVCVHNSGRSQMAEAYLNWAAAQKGLSLISESAGTIAGEKINPAAMEAMREIGIDMTGKRPKQLTQQMADEADQIITMGCGVDADACPARIYISEDWGLDDPAGQPIEDVRRIRDQIRQKVDALIAKL